MISIQRPISSTANLSDKANTILKWVPSAGLWFANALNDNVKSYVFSSESALLNSILQGLYSTQLLNVPKANFVAAVDYLMSLGDSQIQLLQRIASSDLPLESGIAQQLDDFVNQESLVTVDKLTDLQNFFEQYQIQSQPALQLLSLTDATAWIAVCEQIKSANYNKPVVQAALEYTMAQSLDASGLAKTLGYASYIFQTLYSNTQAKRVGAAIQQDFQVINQLVTNFALGKLACPQLGSPQTTGDVGVTLRHWGLQNQFVGFTDLPSAQWQIIRNINLGNSDFTAELPEQFSKLNHAMIGFLQNATVTKQTLTQDANNWIYVVQGNSHQCQFQLAEDGCLTINTISNTK